MTPLSCWLNETSEVAYRTSLPRLRVSSSRIGSKTLCGQYLPNGSGLIPSASGKKSASNATVVSALLRVFLLTM